MLIYIMLLKSRISNFKLKKAQELLPADSDGTSDPYFKLNYCGSEIKSDVIDDTLNPVNNIIFYKISFLIN